MKRLLGVLAATALALVPPLAAQARGGWGGGGGHWGGGGGHGGGGWHGGGGGWHGHYGGYHGYYGGYVLGGLGLGLALGAAYPWSYYGSPYYYGYYGPSYYSDYDYGPPPPAYAAPVAQGSDQACGAWSWVPQQNRYVWVPAGCVGPAPAAY